MPEHSESRGYFWQSRDDGREHALILVGFSEADKHRVGLRISLKKLWAGLSRTEHGIWSQTNVSSNSGPATTWLCDHGQVT